MSDSILQNEDDNKEERAKPKWKKRIGSVCSCLGSINKENKNEIEEVKQKVKEQEELLQSYQSCNGKKQGSNEGSETNKLSTIDEVIPIETSEKLETVSNITIVKASSSSSSSPFQSMVGRRDVRVIRPRESRPKSYPYTTGDHNVVGIEEDVQNLVQQLINPQSGNYFAIVGMGGSGKTTLARRIYNHMEIRRYFVGSAWICVSQVWSEESLIRDIFLQITRTKSNHLTPTEIVKEIKELLGNKPYLVVLDDVWEADALRKIMVPTAISHTCKFVITTRNQNVIQFPDLVFSIHKPRRLTPDQSLDLLKKITFDHQSNTIIMSHRNEPFVELATKMLRKCDGLPLAVISLAGLLRTKKTIQEWMKVSRNVSSKIIEDRVGPSDYGRVEDILGLSYSDLNQTLKCCFMYLSLFPEDVEIRSGMLMRCWIAEGYFKSVWLAPNESIEDVARQYLDELIQRCLVQIAWVNYAEVVQSIRVHDLLRDLSFKKARSNYFSDTFPSSSTKTTMQYLRLGMHSSNLQKLLEGGQDKASRRLRSFVHWFPNLYLDIHLRTLIINCSLLRVLILVSFKTGIPDAIGSLIHLRYLRLSFDYINHLPDSIQNLRNLLSFDFRIKYVFNISVTLPNLRQMKQLRYLRVPQVIGDAESSLYLHDLRNLKVLWGVRSGKWLMKELKYLSPTVEKLGITGIRSCEELEQVYECPSIVEDNLSVLSLEWDDSDAKFEVQKLEHCSQLKKLCLSGALAIATNTPFVFPHYLLKLELSGSELNDQDSFAYALQRLTYLKILRLTLSAYVGVELTFPANSLLDLEILELYQLPNVERVHAMEGAMPQLMSFQVGACYKLRVIPQSLRDVFHKTQ